MGETSDMAYGMKINAVFAIGSRSLSESPVVSVKKGYV